MTQRSKVIRFVYLLPEGVIAEYNKRLNVLLVNKPEYDKLTETQQAIVLKTTSPYMLTMEVSDLPTFEFNISPDEVTAK